MKKLLKIFLILISCFFFFQLLYYVRTFVYPPNMLLQEPLKCSFNSEDRRNRDWREEGFNMFGSEVDRFVTIFMKKREEERLFHFIITYLNQLPDQLSEEQKQLFNKEIKLISDKPISFYFYSKMSSNIHEIQVLKAEKRKLLAQLKEVELKLKEKEMQAHIYEEEQVGEKLGNILSY